MLFIIVIILRVLFINNSENIFARTFCSQQNTQKKKSAALISAALFCYLSFASLNGILIDCVRFIAIVNIDFHGIVSRL